MENFSDLISERGVLSILCRNPKKLFDVDSYIGKNDFYSETNKVIFQSLASAIDRNPDEIDKFTIRNEAIELGFNNYDLLTANNEYTESLFLQKIAASNLEKCVKRVKDLSIKRNVIATLAELSEEAFSSEESKVPATNLLSNVEGRISELFNSIDSKIEVKNLGKGFLDLINDRADNPRQMVGLSTGFQRFDLAIGGGLRRGSVNLIGARAKNFKSGFALNIAKFLGVDKGFEGKNIPVLILDTELQEEYQKFRLGSSVGKIPIDMLETGQWRGNSNIIECATGAATRLEECLIDHVYVGGLPIDQIINISRTWLSKKVGRNPDGQFNDCLIIYDYIKLMDSKGLTANLQEWQVLGFHMTALKNFFIRNNVACLCMCQLNRDGSENDNDTVFAGADRLIWFADNYSILRHKKQDELEEDGLSAGNMRIKVIGGRYGPGMAPNDYLNLKVNHSCMFAVEGKLKSELKPQGEVDKEVADEIDDEEME